MLQVVGKITCLTVASAVALVVFAILNARFLASRWNPLLRPSLAVIDFLHLQVKMLYSWVAGSSSRFDGMMVAARNVLNRRRFVASTRRVFLAPHCLRHVECPAVSTQYGLQCIECGKCKLGKIKSACDAHGIQLFILAGSSFVKKLVQETKPDGILLLGCPYEINKVMRHLKRFATYGLLLTRDGCVNTDTDIDDVVQAIETSVAEAFAETQ